MKLLEGTVPVGGDYQVGVEFHLYIEACGRKWEGFQDGESRGVR